MPPSCDTSEIELTFDDRDGHHEEGTYSIDRDDCLSQERSHDELAGILTHEIVNVHGCLTEPLRACAVRLAAVRGCDRKRLLSAALGGPQVCARSQSSSSSTTTTTLLLLLL